MSNAAVEAAGTRTEKFQAPMGRYLGYVVVAAAVLLILFALITGVDEARGIALFSFAFAAATWVVLIRPLVAASSNGLLMQNMLRDTFVPWARVKGCRAAQTLQISTRDRVYHGLGVSKSARAATRERKLARREQPVGPMTGLSRVQYMPTETPVQTGASQVNMAKQEHVIQNNFTHIEQRIEALAVERGAATTEQSVVVAWDPIPVVALITAVAAVLLAILL